MEHKEKKTKIVRIADYFFVQYDLRVLVLALSQEKLVYWYLILKHEWK